MQSVSMKLCCVASIKKSSSHSLTSQPQYDLCMLLNQFRHFSASCSCKKCYYKTETARLWHVQNVAARLISKIQTFDHITPTLLSLHWLPIEARISFKILLPTYKILNGLAPGQVICLNWYRPTNPIALIFSRSAKNNLLHDSKRLAISLASPVLWNSISSLIRNSSSAPTFKKKLKTYIFLI